MTAIIGRAWTHRKGGITLRCKRQRNFAAKRARLELRLTQVSSEVAKSNGKARLDCEAVVIDSVTSELLHVGGDGFKY